MTPQPVAAAAEEAEEAEERLGGDCSRVTAPPAPAALNSRSPLVVTSTLPGSVTNGVIRHARDSNAMTSLLLPFLPLLPSSSLSPAEAVRRRPSTRRPKAPPPPLPSPLSLLPFPALSAVSSPPSLPPSQKDKSAAVKKVLSWSSLIREASDVVAEEPVPSRPPSPPSPSPRALATARGTSLPHSPRTSSASREVGKQNRKTACFITRL